MEAELATQNKVHQGSSYHIPNKENNWEKSIFNNDDWEMFSSKVWELSNEATDVQYQENADNFQIVPEEKLSFQNVQFTKYSTLEHNKKYSVYSGIAGDLISPALHQYTFCNTKCYNSEYLSQPIQSSFNETTYAEESDLKALLISKFHGENTFSENENNLVFLVTSSHELKKASAQKVPQSADQNGNSFDVVRDEPGTEKRTMSESYVSIIQNKANYSLIQKNKSNSIQEVPEAYCWYDKLNEKWNSIERYIKEQQSIYNGSAGDLMSSVHASNAYFPKDTKNILENLSQPRAPSNEDFIHKIKYDSSLCMPERMSPKTAVTINDIGSKGSEVNFIDSLTHIKSKYSQIQTEMSKTTSKVLTNDNSLLDSVPFAAEGSPSRNWKWMDRKNHIQEQHCTYSGFAGELVSCTSGMPIHMPQKKHTTLRNLSQPTECHKMTEQVMLETKSNFKVFRELPFSTEYSACNTCTINEDDEIMLSNKTTENHDVILKAVDKSTETTVNKNVYMNDTNQACDALSISKKCTLTDINSCKSLQEQLDSNGAEDQTVPNRVEKTGNENDECPDTVSNTNSPRVASNNSECKRFSPDVFAEKDDDTSLFADSPVNVSADNVNTDLKETVKKNKSLHEFPNISDMHVGSDTSIHRLSQNVTEQLEAKENKNLSINDAKMNDLIRRVENKSDLVSFEKESLLEDDCLHAADVFPVCLTQPAIPTYLLRSNRSELSYNASKGFKSAVKDLKRCAEQLHQEKTENITGSITLNSSSENNSTTKSSCKFTMSKTTSCTSSILTTSMCYQKPQVLPCDSKNSQKKTFSSDIPPCNSAAQESSGIQPNLQNEKNNKINDNLHKSRISETESKDINAQHKPPCNKNAHSNDHIPLSPMPENGNVSEKQMQNEQTDNGYLHTKPSYDTSNNEIMSVKNISDLENCENATEKQCSNNSVLTELFVMEEQKCCFETLVNDHPSLIQQSSSNERYLDIAENLCNEYSLSSTTTLKRETLIKYIKEKDREEMEVNADSSEEEYDTDVSISEVTSESNIDLQIDEAIKKYQNTSSGSENTLMTGSQHMISTSEVSVQTDVSGLVQVKQCICQKFNFCCELCNQSELKPSENIEKKRHAASSDSEIPLNKKAKCYSEKILIKSRTNNETENKLEAEESIKYPEDIKNLCHTSFSNNSITSPLSATCDYKHSSEHSEEHHNIQGIYRHKQLFSWYTVEKSTPSQRCQEVNEQAIQQKSKQRAPLRLGLSKRAKTKPLHYSCN